MEINHALLKRLADFGLDDPDASFPFSAKLAKENSWTPVFTARAIEEYKRFCYLAVTDGHPVSPSQVVDQVWHLHLTYSYNYWQVFCPKVLQTHFHHHPSKGGIEERAKFDDWTANTHASYRVAFGAEPPADIWIDAEPIPTGPAEDRHYHIPKALVRNASQGVGLAVGLLILAGCTEAIEGNALDMRGPEFLQFYLFLAAITFAAALLIRNLLKLPSMLGGSIPSDLDPYSVAYLNGKSVLAVNTAITSLLTQGVLELNMNTLRLRTLRHDFSPTHRLEQAVFANSSGMNGIKTSTLRACCKPELEKIHEDLTNQGYLLSAKQRIIVVASSIVIAMAAPTYGLMKIFVGINRERPVLFLEILCSLSVVACLFLLLTPFRTRRGDKMLASIRKYRSHLRTVGFHSGHASKDEIVLGMAIFGVASLSGSAYAKPVRRLTPPAGSQSCGGGSFISVGSSSGGGDSGNGSSCGGSSGCGGGGGGGCGGCGSS